MEHIVWWSAFTADATAWRRPFCPEEMILSHFRKISPWLAAFKRLDEHTGGIRDHLPFVWGLLVANAWIRRYQGQASRGRRGQELAAT